MVEIFLPTMRWTAETRGLLGHLQWMSREYDVLVSVSDNSQNAEKHAHLDGLAKGNERFRVLVQPSRLPMFRHFAVLFARATRPYGMLLSDDDWIAPDYVLGVEKTFAERADVAGVMGIVLRLTPGTDAAVQEPVNIAANDAAARIEQYLTRVSYFNLPVYSVFRTDAMQAFCRYAEHHPLAASFFDYLMIFALLSRGGLASRAQGPYVYCNTNWSSPERVRESNQRMYMDFGLPRWFSNFHVLYRAVEGFRFLAGPGSPIEDRATREAAALAVFTHYLNRFRRQMVGAAAAWWEDLRQLRIANHAEPFKGAQAITPLEALEHFLAVLKTGSPGLHARYVTFHQGRIQR
jgi:hypothetical protein